MRKVEFEQGSTEWLTWRKSLLTATDAPVIMGVSPYDTPYKRWQKKVGLAEEQKSNPAMLRGQVDEPIARDWFNQEYGLGMEPCCVESDIYNFIGSSLDGLSKCGKYILEIKSNGDQYHFGLNNGLPDFHMMQMQHQLLSTDNTAEMGFYLSYNKGEKIVKEVHPDKEWYDEYLPKAKEFWRRVVFVEAPELTRKDYKEMHDDHNWESSAKRYIEVCDQMKILQETKDNYRNNLLLMCGDNSCLGHGIKVMKKVSKGRIQYDSVAELAGIDLEKYRDSPSVSWAITLDKK